MSLPAGHQVGHAPDPDLPGLHGEEGGEVGGVGGHHDHGEEVPEGGEEAGGVGDGGDVGALLGQPAKGEEERVGQVELVPQPVIVIAIYTRDRNTWFFIFRK